MSRALLLGIALFTLACTTPRLRASCTRAVSSGVTSIYETKDKMKKSALAPGDVRQARVQLEEVRRDIYLRKCDQRDRDATKFEESLMQFGRAEAIVVELEAHRGVRWDNEIAIRDLTPEYELEWRALEDDRPLTPEEMDAL